MLKKCQIFTPKKQIDQLLDILGYRRNVVGHKILENACGDGRILVEIVKRYIEDALSQQLSFQEIVCRIEEDIFGIELDKDYCEITKVELNKVANAYSLPKINWNIINSDSLYYDFGVTFDFIVGNPPYITHHDIDKKTRDKVRETFYSCQFGRFDYCYAFIERSIELLAQNGKMAYLIPSSLFKTVYGARIREKILPHLEYICDYKTVKVFPNALTAPAIIYLSLDSQRDTIRYENENGYQLEKRKNDLNEKWLFADDEDIIPRLKFGDYFKVANTIATLRNRVFVIQDYSIEDGYVVWNDQKIEKTATRITTSPRSKAMNKKERIIFPYDFKNHSIIRYSEKDYNELFPLAYNYLSSQKMELLKRKSDESAQWFEYGRSQAIMHMNQPKLIISSVITNKVNVYKLSSQTVPYSGFYIIPRGKNRLSIAKKILESNRFFQYITEIGVNVSGSSLRITSEDIKDYRFYEEELL